MRNTIDEIKELKDKFYDTLQKLEKLKISRKRDIAIINIKRIIAKIDNSISNIN